MFDTTLRETFIALFEFIRNALNGDVPDNFWYYWCGIGLAVFMLLLSFSERRNMKKYKYSFTRVVHEKHEVEFNANNFEEARSKVEALETKIVKTTVQKEPFGYCLEEIKDSGEFKSE